MKIGVLLLTDGYQRTGGISGMKVLLHLWVDLRFVQILKFSMIHQRIISNQKTQVLILLLDRTLILTDSLGVVGSYKVEHYSLLVVVLKHELSNQLKILLSEPFLERTVDYRRHSERLVVVLYLHLKELHTQKGLHLIIMSSHMIYGQHLIGEQLKLFLRMMIMDLLLISNLVERSIGELSGGMMLVVLDTLMILLVLQIATLLVMVSLDSILDIHGVSHVQHGHKKKLMLV